MGALTSWSETDALARAAATHRRLTGRPPATGRGTAERVQKEGGPAPVRDAVAAAARLVSAAACASRRFPSGQFASLQPGRHSAAALLAAPARPSAAADSSVAQHTWRQSLR